MYSILFNWIYYKKDDKTFKLPCKEVTYSQIESLNTRFKFEKTLTAKSDNFQDLRGCSIWFETNNGIYSLSEFIPSLSYVWNKDGITYTFKVLDNVEADLTSITDFTTLSNCNYRNDFLNIDNQPINYIQLDYSKSLENNTITYNVSYNTLSKLNLTPYKEYNIECPIGSFTGFMQESFKNTYYTYTFTGQTNSSFNRSQTTIEYRWTEDGFTCNGFNKYKRLKEQYFDTTWKDTGKYKQGSLIQVNSEDCGYVFAPIYEWKEDNHTICRDGNLYNTYAEWVDTTGEGFRKTNRYKIRNLIESDSASCGVEWKEVPNKYYCFTYYAPTIIEFTNNTWAIPFIGSYLDVDWGDSTTEHCTVSPAKHTYNKTDTYRVSFKGDILEWTLRFQECKILQFGTDGVPTGDGSGVTYFGKSLGCFNNVSYFPKLTLTNLQEVDSHFLSDAKNLTNMDYAFKGSKLIKPIIIPKTVLSVKGIYQNSTLKDASSAFINSNIIDATNAFPKLSSLNSAFYNSKVETVGTVEIDNDADLRNSFSNSNIEMVEFICSGAPSCNMESAFFLCKHLKSIPTINGEYPWTYSTITNYTGCFKGINTDVPDYNLIPETWK